MKHQQDLSDGRPGKHARSGDQDLQAENRELRERVLALEERVRALTPDGSPNAE